MSAGFIENGTEMCYLLKEILSSFIKKLKFVKIPNPLGLKKQALSTVNKSTGK